MLYILTNIFNLSQWEKLQYQTINQIRKSLNRIMEIHKQVIIVEINDIILMEISHELQVDPQNVLDIALHIKEILDAEKENILGYNIIITTINQSSHLTIINKYKSIFLSLTEDERIWIRANLENLFFKLVDFKKTGDYWIITQQKKVDAGEDLSPVSRKIQLPAGELLNSALTPLINHTASYQAIHFYGPAGTGKSIIIGDLINAIYPSQNAGYVIKNHVRFKKSSQIHPLLNGLNPQFLLEIPEWLNPYELSIWKKESGILKYLKSITSSEKCPDHIFEDFFICYNLYITAYLRAMENNFLPALFILDDLDKYHKKTLHSLSLLIKDFIKIPGFIPVFISRKAGLPQEFDFIILKRIKSAFLGIKEIQKIADLKYPGFKPDEKICGEIVKNTTGNVVPVLLNLLSLNLHKKKEQSPNLDENQDNILWYLIESLDKPALDVLFSIYLSGGLLPGDELKNFLFSSGLKQEAIDKSIRLLTQYYLISPDYYLVPTFPHFRMKLEIHMGKRSGYLKGLISDFIINLCEKKQLSNLVLLFSFYMNNNFPGPALKTLARLLKRKIDEHDLAGARPFLIPKNFSFPEGLNDEQKYLLKIIIASAKIRLLLLENNLKSAGSTVENILKHKSGFLPNRYQGELQLNIARFYLVSGEPELSIQFIKKSLLIFQESTNLFLTGLAYRMLGYIMLVKAKIDDAIDYLNLADKQLDEKEHPYDKIQVLTSAAIAHYLKGELSKSLVKANRGMKIAADSARRSYQLFLNFLAARIYFDYGSYDKALSLFQKNLTLAYCYSQKKALLVNYRWLARTQIYNSNTQTGLSILEKLGESRECLFFQSEGFYFQERAAEAHRAMEKAIALPEEPVSLSDENICWPDGLHGIEGRYQISEGNSTIFSRLLRAHQAFFQGLAGDPAESINTLYTITRGESFTGKDPYSHLYYYLYACLLYKYKNKNTEDSLTILNKAIKQLQERASKIDEPLERTKYLNKNYWNSRLLAEGRKRKLM